MMSRHAIHGVLKTEAGWIADQQTCWDGMEGTGPFTIRMANWEWEIVELCSHSELVADGHDMRHCVAGYGRSCRRGRDAIFSLRSKQSDDPKMDRDVTIQVDRETRRVVQARGYRNSRPYFNCVRVMRIWAQRNDLDSWGSVLERLQTIGVGRGRCRPARPRAVGRTSPRQNRPHEDALVYYLFRRLSR